MHTTTPETGDELRMAHGQGNIKAIETAWFSLKMGEH